MMYASTASITTSRVSSSLRSRRVAKVEVEMERRPSDRGRWGFSPGLVPTCFPLSNPEQNPFLVWDHAIVYRRAYESDSNGLLVGTSYSVVKLGRGYVDVFIVCEVGVATACNRCRTRSLSHTRDVLRDPRAS